MQLLLWCSSQAASSSSKGKGAKQFRVVQGSWEVPQNATLSVHFANKSMTRSKRLGFRMRVKQEHKREHKAVLHRDATSPGSK